MTGPFTELAGTERAIGRRRIAAGEARTVNIKRRYDAPIEDVWDACTTPDRIARWFLPVRGDLRLGGTFHLQGNASGTILHCEPPRLLRLTWEYGGRSPNEVELRLSPLGDEATLLEIDHATVDRLVEVEGRRVDPFLNDAPTGIWGMGTGWELPLTYGLTGLLRGEPPPGPAGVAPSPEVAARIAAIGRAWVALVEADRAAHGP